MQNNPNGFNSPTLVLVLLALANSATAVVSAFITYLFTRPRQVADIHKSKAETLKTEAEARQIDAETIREAYERLGDLEMIIDTLRNEKINDRQRMAQLEWEASLSSQREKLLNQQMELAHAELKVLREPK